MEQDSEPKPVVVRPLGGQALAVLAKRAEQLDVRAYLVYREAEELLDRAAAVRTEADRLARTAAELKRLHAELSRTTGGTDHCGHVGDVLDPDTNNPVVCVGEARHKGWHGDGDVTCWPNEAEEQTPGHLGPAAHDGPLLCEKVPGDFGCLLGRDHEGSCAVQDTGWEWEL